MSESSEVPVEQKPRFSLNESGEIISSKPQSRARQFLHHLRMLYHYGRTGLERGWYRKPKRGEVKSNLDALRASLKNSTEVNITPEGKM